MRSGPISIVVDTSALLAVLLSEAARSTVLAATKGVTLLAAPSLPWEVGNALIALARRRLARRQEVQRAWSAFIEIPLRYVDVDVPAALTLALDQGIYAYDAYVIEAARGARVPLLSLDQQQCRAAAAAGLELVEIAV
jgi:predicted nucleic acid-binding protein